MISHAETTMTLGPEAVMADLARVLGPLFDAPVATARATAGGEVHWIAQVAVSGAREGTLLLGWSAADAARLADVLQRPEPRADESRVREALQEITDQMAAVLDEAGAPRGERLVSGGVSAAAEILPAEPPAVYDLTVEGQPALRVSCWIRLQPVAGADPALPAAGVGPVLDLILDIDLPLAVRFGQTEMTLQALTRLGPGAVIDLRRTPDDPVDVLVNGHLVARGQVVVVAGTYGVRIMEIVSPADRLRQVAG